MVYGSDANRKVPSSHVILNSEPACRRKGSLPTPLPAQDRVTASIADWLMVMLVGLGILVWKLHGQATGGGQKISQPVPCQSKSRGMLRGVCRGRDEEKV